MKATLWVMLWTSCLILFVLWLLALLLDVESEAIHLLPALIAVLVIARLTRGVRRA